MSSKKQTCLIVLVTGKHSNRKNTAKEIILFYNFVSSDHIEYIRNLVGADFVGIGSDFDGIDM